MKFTMGWIWSFITNRTEFLLPILPSPPTLIPHTNMDACFWKFMLMNIQRLKKKKKKKKKKNRYCYYFPVAFLTSWWQSGKESAYQRRRCKRCRLDSWVRKIPWSRKWQCTPVFLPGKSHGLSSLTGCSPWDHGELLKNEELTLSIL